MMNKKQYRTHPLPLRRRREERGRIGFSPWAARLALTGLLPIVGAVCGYAARFADALAAGETGILLRLGPEAQPIAAAMAILTGGVLLLDYQERLTEKRKP